MPLKPASRPVVAALLIGLTKGAAALSSPASSASSPPPIVLRTPIFSLSLDPGSCQATADYLKHPRMTSTAAPFVSFYNRVADNRATNLDSCVSVSVVAAADHQQQQSGVGDELTVLRVTAAHGAGTVDISVRPGPEHLIFQIENLSNWTGADPVERHIAFGEFWTGMPGMDAVSNPPVMGKLQGPFGTPGSNATVAAGFMSISNRYMRFIRSSSNSAWPPRLCAMCICIIDCGNLNWLLKPNMFSWLRVATQHLLPLHLLRNKRTETGIRDMSDA
jgi:hypothetical protein